MSRRALRVDGEGRFEGFAVTADVLVIGSGHSGPAIRQWGPGAQGLRVPMGSRRATPIPPGHTYGWAPELEAQGLGPSAGAPRSNCISYFVGCGTHQARLTAC